MEENYRVINTESDLNFGHGIPQFQIFLRKDPRTRSSWKQMYKPDGYAEAHDWARSKQKRKGSTPSAEIMSPDLKRAAKAPELESVQSRAENGNGEPAVRIVCVNQAKMI